ncbi:uncharacterized protein LOC133201620 [Saccostrea echinata]|uniref:uncharacterized protein LOC133201620 n=1 Tax=Saccostrea echinata TaxID=191078 RepID=UPI002A7F12D6|nr:uncharacterized protein LOC133201620 [Saccostrea echinata]
MIQSLIQSTVSENKSILDSSESSKLIHYTSRNEDFRYVPSSFELTVPQLNPMDFTEEELCLMIGVIPNTIKSNIPASVTLPIQSSIEPYKQFIDKPIVMESVETGYGKINGINCIPYTDEFYVSGNSEIILRMNTGGEILDEIITTSRGMPYDTGVTPEGCLVYTESLSNLHL